MKTKFHLIRSVKITKQIESKEAQIEDNYNQLLSSIKNGQSDKIINALVSSRNILSCDLDNLKKQLDFVKKGKSQYGDEVKTEGVRMYIDVNIL